MKSQYTPSSYLKTQKYHKHKRFICDEESTLEAVKAHMLVSQHTLCVSGVSR